MRLLCLYLLINWITCSIVYQNNIAGEHGLIGELTIHSHEEPVDAIEAFRLKHQLPEHLRHQLMKTVCQKATCSREQPVVYSMSVKNGEGTLLPTLTVLANEEAADVVYAYSKQNVLSAGERSNLVESLCVTLKVKCTRRSPIVFQQTIRDEKNTYGELSILESEEAIDIIHSFVQKYKLTRQMRTNVLDQICQQIKCSRTVPVLFHQPVQGASGSILGDLVISEGQDPADVVLHFSQTYGLNEYEHNNILNAICERPELNCNRMQIVVLSINVMNGTGDPLGTLEVHEDEETVDAIYAFGKVNNMTNYDRHELLQNVCANGQSLCTRGRALLLTFPVNSEDNAFIDNVYIFEGDEPVDAIYTFCARHQISTKIRRAVIDAICYKYVYPESRKAVECTRDAPLAFSIPIADEKGEFVENLNIEEGQEPVDAIAPFCKKHDYTDFQRNNLLEGVCKASGLPCTRNKAIYYTRTVKTTNGEIMGTFQIQEEDEPTDVIYDFAQHHGLNRTTRQDLLVTTCHERRNKFNCTRAEPRLLSMKMMETETEELGTLEVLEGQEPVDVVYAFLEKHDLLQSEVNTSLIETVCNSTRVVCSRRKPRRMMFSLQATYRGIPHSIQYVQPEEDWHCSDHNGGTKCVHHVETLSQEYCAFHMPDWDGCPPLIMDALRNSLDIYETDIWKGKDMYAKLGLVRTASDDDIEAAYNTLVLRFNNATEPTKYEKLQEAYRTLSDVEEKYYYDLPCIKFFGLCGKKNKDGGISISA